MDSLVIVIPSVAYYRSSSYILITTTYSEINTGFYSLPICIWKTSCEIKLTKRLRTGLKVAMIRPTSRISFYSPVVLSAEEGAKYTHARSSEPNACAVGYTGYLIPSWSTPVTGAAGGWFVVPEGIPSVKTCSVVGSHTNSWRLATCPTFDVHVDLSFAGACNEDCVSHVVFFTAQSAPRAIWKLVWVGIGSPI